MDLFLRLFETYSFALQLGFLAVAWAWCHFHPHWLAQAVAAPLLTRLIGMLIVLAIFLGLKEWLPGSEWSSIIWLETESSRIEIFLEKLTPYPFIQSLGLLLVLTILNIRYPTWKPWSKGLEKALSTCAKAIAVLSVFTSFTFFATGQSNIIKKATAEEKYERVKDQANACARLIIGRRLTEDTKAEAKTANDFLAAVDSQIKIDMRLFFPTGLRERNGGITADKDRWRQLVGGHVRELLKARDATPAVRRMKYTIKKSRLADMISRRFTRDQITEANEQFKKALDMFVERGADIPLDPLTRLLESVGLPELPGAIVKTLYTTAISHLAEKVTKPLADSLFRPNSIQENTALADISEIANDPVFDVGALPTRLIAPTIEDRAPELAAREKAVEEAGQELRRLSDPNNELKDIARDAAKNAERR